MAAYAALGSLMHTIEHVELQHHPRPSISLDKSQVLFLTEKVTFFQEFLDGRNTDIESNGLESRIADIARAAQDIIESRFVDLILAGPASPHEKKFYTYVQKAVSRILTGFSGDDVRAFYKSLQKVLESMDLIKKEVMEIKETTTTPIQAHLLRDQAPRDPVRSSFRGEKVVVGFDDVLVEMLDKLTSEESTRQIIPVVGMGGIGKSTLARTVYSNQLIRHHFDVFAWTAISQQYNGTEIFVHLLSQLDKVDKVDLLEMSLKELKEKLHKVLVGRRYLIILDDIWDIEAWDEIQLFFPDCSNRSRVVVTTRLSNLASQLNGSYCLNMKLLDEVESWNLFCEVVFGKDSCPLDDLEEIGKKIARGCRGLPLSICVVGGLLSKSKDEIQYWEYVVKNVNSVVNLEDNEHCLKILHTSYRRLPSHLKSCFLYMAIFLEDKKIRVSEVIELWVSEGFLKPIDGISLEVVAKDYFNELVERNLISVHSLGSLGTIKYCNIHDLLRDFCLRQAQKERFVDVLELHNLNITPQSRDTQRRPFDSDDWRFVLEEKYHDPFRSMQLPCSLYCHSQRYPMRPNSRLLRIWTKCRGSFFFRYGDSLQNMFISKYYTAQPQEIANLSALTHTFWNFKTLEMYARMVLMAPSQIWNMPHLSHVRVQNLELPDPPSGNDSVLGNLQTLSRVKNFKCSEEIMKRIPNIKKLQIAYTCRFDNKEASLHLLHNIGRLCTLKSLGITFLSYPVFWQRLTFPNSLMKLTITRFSAEQVLEKIGSLPHLVKLKLIQGFFDKREWVTVEGQFRSLKFLLISNCFQLESWKTESTHFPRLEHLALCELYELKEIPLDIGEISTLASICVRWCNYSVVRSAKNILKEQKELGNESLQLGFQD